MILLKNSNYISMVAQKVACISVSLSCLSSLVNVTAGIISYCVLLDLVLKTK